MRLRNTVLLWVLQQAPLLLMVAVFLVFGILSDKFLQFENVVNILIQSSPIAIAAVGMTFVLLTAGVDLSVGSVMFLSVAVAGKMVFAEYPIAIAFLVAVAVGAGVGAINGVLVTKLRMISFIATLGMLFVVRGFGLWLTNTRAMNMPDAVNELGLGSWLGIPSPIVIMAIVACAAHAGLNKTAWGRQIYAIGSDIDAARKAGVRVEWILWSVYVVCGACAAISGLVSLTQTGAVSPTFGTQQEFSAIAAAVLGGTSLFGGRGNVLPGAIFGAMLFQTVQNALVILNADPYLYPMILSGIIFLAVLLDASRDALVRRLNRRRIISDP